VILERTHDPVSRAVPDPQTPAHTRAPLGWRACARAVAVLALLLLVPGSRAEAAVISSYTLPELVQQSDVICVGKVVKTKAQGKTEISTPYRDKEGKEIKVKVDRMEAEFAPEDVLKGQLEPGSVRVWFPGNPPPNPGGPPLMFTQLEADERVLLFLTRAEEKGVWALLHPSSIPPTKITLGTARPKAVGDAGSPLRKILLYLTAGVREGEAVIRSACLPRLAEIGFLLYAPLDAEERRSLRLMTLRREIGEHGMELETLVRRDVMPTLLEVAKRGDPATQQAATFVAASLQSTDVIPDLFVIAKRDPQVSPAVAGILADYRVPEAAKHMIPLLKHEAPAVRMAAATALDRIGDSRALPFLIDRLDDPDLETRYHVVSALHSITGQPGLPSIPLFQQTQGKEHVTFWKNWATGHEAVLQKNREGFKP
jgi:hypothetical protein